MIAEPFSAVLELLYTLPGLDKNPMTAIAILSEIGPDMSVFPSSKHLRKVRLFPGLAAVHGMTRATQK